MSNQPVQLRNCVRKRKAPKEIPWELIDKFDAGTKRLMDSVKRNAPSKEAIFTKTLNGKASPRLAIKAKCLDCASFTVAEIRDCQVFGCPLWRYRPYQNSTEGE